MIAKQLASYFALVHISGQMKATSHDPHPKLWFSKGKSLKISGKSRLLKYDSICPDIYVCVGYLNSQGVSRVQVYALACDAKHCRLLQEARCMQMGFWGFGFDSS